MKVTFDLPATLLRSARSMAAKEGESLSAFVTEALVAHIAGNKDQQPIENEPAWMKHYGGLAHISDEVQRMQQEIDVTFGSVDDAEWK